MTTRSEREKAQKLNEQHQAILSKMLREEDNKYCADCEAKGAANLGVHISRVKSVNLDQWTSEQIQSIQEMGNTKARQLYEANLPDNFRRPQTDQYPLLSADTETCSVGSSSTSASTPTQAPAAGVGASSGSGQGDLDLFSDNSSATKAEDGAKKPLSKDSILSLYGTNSMSQQAPAAGMFVGPSQMQFPVQATPGYQAFPGMGTAVPPTTVMGAMMAQGGTAMMGPNPAMMVGMTMPNGFMGNAPAAGVMGMAPRMMGPQGAAMPAGMMPAQGMYAIQPGQQAQWSMGQVWRLFS
ncbi:hypothetical protein GOODEAATRI_007949 [Goodea atripinnis]|uniref:Arf-GAP domain-containing protein n=1 Tax=Goodea atripinnis TaxID=208336 RepID=A0ABV0NIG8_9TELE